MENADFVFVVLHELAANVFENELLLGLLW